MLFEGNEYNWVGGGEKAQIEAAIASSLAAAKANNPNTGLSIDQMIYKIDLDERSKWIVDQTQDGDKLNIGRDIKIPSHDEVDEADDIILNYYETIFDKFTVIKGDGNCFYRAYLMGYIEVAINTFYGDGDGDTGDDDLIKKLIIFMTESIKVISLVYKKIHHNRIYDYDSRSDPPNLKYTQNLHILNIQLFINILQYILTHKIINIDSSEWKSVMSDMNNLYRNKLDVIVSNMVTKITKIKNSTTKLSPLTETYNRILPKYTNNTMRRYDTLPFLFFILNYLDPLDKAIIYGCRHLIVYQFVNNEHDTLQYFNGDSVDNHLHKTGNTFMKMIPQFYIEAGKYTWNEQEQKTIYTHEYGINPERDIELAEYTEEVARNPTEKLDIRQEYIDRIFQEMLSMGAFSVINHIIWNSLSTNADYILPINLFQARSNTTKKDYLNNVFYINEYDSTKRTTTFNHINVFYTGSHYSVIFKKKTDTTTSNNIYYSELLFKSPIIPLITKVIDIEACSTESNECIKVSDSTTDKKLANTLMKDTTLHIARKIGNSTNYAIIPSDIKDTMDMESVKTINHLYGLLQHRDNTLYNNIDLYVARSSSLINDRIIIIEPSDVYKKVGIVKIHNEYKLNITQFDTNSDEHERLKAFEDKYFYILYDDIKKFPVSTKTINILTTPVNIYQLKEIPKYSNNNLSINVYILFIIDYLRKKNCKEEQIKIICNYIDKKYFNFEKIHLNAKQQRKYNESIKQLLELDNKIDIIIEQLQGIFEKLGRSDSIIGVLYKMLPTFFDYMIEQYKRSLSVQDNTSYYVNLFEYIYSREDIIQIGSGGSLFTLNEVIFTEIKIKLGRAVRKISRKDYYSAPDAPRADTSAAARAAGPSADASTLACPLLEGESTRFNTMSPEQRELFDSMSAEHQAIVCEVTAFATYLTVSQVAKALTFYDTSEFVLTWLTSENPSDQADIEAAKDINIGGKAYEDYLKKSS